MAIVRKTKEIEQFIINHVGEHPREIGRITAEKFKISRSAVSKHLKALIEKGVLTAKGVTKARTYQLALYVDKVFEIAVTPELQEDLVWTTDVKPLLLNNTDAIKTVIDICDYGFTEMLNNVIDHSESKLVRVHVYIDAISIQIYIVDFGIGIFRKIQNDFHLNDPRHALLELSKGKLTSDKTKHTGQGIFFTSRMFDKFSILSGELYFSRINKKHDWLIEVEDRSEFRGTHIRMYINLSAPQTMKEVFDRYASEHDDYGFTKTHVPISLTKYDDGELVSRSAAKRLLARFSEFKEVWLDFKGVSSIGQAFADEIFRVYKASHPDVNILYSRANEDIEKMINRATGSGSDEGGGQLELIED